MNSDGKLAPTDALLVSALTASRMLNISRALLYQMQSDGRLGPLPVAFGRRKLWVVDELRRWVQHDPPCPPREMWIKEYQR